MSEDNKDLGDKAEEAFDKAKDVAQDAAEDVKEEAGKAKEKAGEFADDVKDAAGKAKEKAGEFADDAKEAANEFKDDVKNAFDPKNPESGKTIAIIAHITLIGWIIAIIMNSSNKSELGSFYIRQMLGIMLLGFVLGLLPVVNLIAWIIPLVLWVISLIGAVNGNQKPVFLVGDYFQSWFKGL